MKNLIVLLSIFISTAVVAQRPLSKEATAGVAKALSEVTSKSVAGCYVTISSTRIVKEGGGYTLEIYASKELEYYPMREESVTHLYSVVRNSLPEPYKNYLLRIYANGKHIEKLIPQYFDSTPSGSTFAYASQLPLVRRISSLSQPSKALLGRHIAMWQSHGRHYDSRYDIWRWQRPCLWQTVEDLYTQSYVVPFLLPMLERAGATVLLPRERSMLCEEVIIDNDRSALMTTYSERSRRHCWEDAGVGFAHIRQYYRSGHNPFEDGTARKVATTDSQKRLSVATWGGDIPVSGVYTLYVSYKSLEESVEDAHYTVYATGGKREFLVNQRMGGGMWVPLGEFYFAAGHHSVLVTLDNHSAMEGVVTADAVKIGGGMGNIARGKNSKTSGYPRFTEGARYWLQWSGFAEDVYAPKGHTDDYKEDYMSRAHWVNALMGGSQYLDSVAGKSIPIDLAFALHSDAGVRSTDEIIGSLGIYCTSDGEGHFPNGVSRMRSRDLTDIVLTQIVEDIRLKYEPEWMRRGMWDRLYYEARIPACPTMLLELLSHQNFADMRYGWDPAFRFDVSRAIYKGILRFVANQYGAEYIVQPLPVTAFSAELRDKRAYLRWQPTVDSLEPTAAPDYYILYTRVDGGGFDTGRRVEGCAIELDIEPNKVYSFRVTAVNEGGESFDSETLSLCRVPRAKGVVMVVNGFDRVAPPASYRNDAEAGFRSGEDSGVGYIADIAFVGHQRDFSYDSPNHGSCDTNYETYVIAGNTFDYTAMHGTAFCDAGYSFCSSSRAAVEGYNVGLGSYDIVDVIFGKQRTTMVGRGVAGYRHEVFGDAMQRALEGYLKGGGRVILSGSYMLEDICCSPLSSSEDREWVRRVLAVDYGGNSHPCNGVVHTCSKGFARRAMSLRFNTTLSSEIYAVERCDALCSVEGASHAILCYGCDDAPAAGVISDNGRVTVVGFPLELLDDIERTALIDKILKYSNKLR